MFVVETEVGPVEYDEYELEDMVHDCIVDGLCTSCGAEGMRVEPDAHNYSCEKCGKPTVSSPLILLGVM